MNKQTKRRIRLENPENELMLARAENGGGIGKMGGGYWEIQASRYGGKKSRECTV